MVAAGICRMGEGGWVEKANLREPQLCVKDEGREGGKAKPCWNAVNYDATLASN